LGVLQILPQHESIHLAFRLTSAAFTENNLRRRAELGFVFDSGRMMKARHFQSKGLTATSGTQFERSKIHSVGGAERIVRRGSSADICCGRNNERRHRDTTTSGGR
jgi:hypothetical protein